MPPPPSHKKNFNFSQKKEQTIRSLKEVNYFLCHLDKAIKYIKIYNWFK